MHNRLELAKYLGEQLKTKHQKLAVAESCTGGSLAAALTDIPESSAWFERGFVTYSNEAKEELLGVTSETLQKTGAVSEATVREMAEGAILNSNANLSVSISGIAGPGGATKDKPIGTVWLAFAGLGEPTETICYTFEGNRQEVRDAAVLAALQGLIKRTEAYTPPPKTSPRYFFALFPDEATRTQLDSAAETFIKHTTCKKSLPQNLHLTLAYLGPLENKIRDRLKSFSCPIAPFEMIFTEACHFAASNTAYFKPEPSKPLKALHQSLCQYLLQTGLKPERRALKPHITIARHYQDALKPYALPKPIHWFAHELCLVASTPGANTSHYEIIQRTPLRLKTC